MARPLKEGLDYFPLDVDMAEDKRVQFVVGKCGQEGFATIIHLLMAIYRNGYYLTWDELELYSTSQRINLPVNTISEVINHLLNYGFFDKEKFDLFGILTSHGIQTRYLRACEYRKKVKMVKEFCLIVPSDGIKESRFDYINPPKSIKQVGNTNTYGIKQVENSGETPTPTVLTKEKTPQSKGKESSNVVVVNARAREAEKTSAEDEAVSKIFTLFDNNIHPVTGEIETDMLTDLLEHYGEEWLSEAIKEAALNHGTSVKYIESILKAWERNGFKAPKERSKRKNGCRLPGAHQQDREPQESESSRKLAADLDYYESHQVYPWEVQSAGAGDGGKQEQDSGN